MNDHNRLVEQEGVYSVGRLFSQLGYLFRQIREHDKGVDAEIELTQSLGTFPPIIGVQVKARSEFRHTADNKISITVTEQNLEYWQKYGRPVILAAYSCEDENIYWAQVDNTTTRTIKIDLHQRLDESTLIQFPRLIFQYYARLAYSLPIEGVADVLKPFGSHVGDVLDPILQKLEKAQELFDCGEYSTAASLYRSLVTIYDTNPSLLYNAGVTQLLSGDIDQAVDFSTRLLNIASESAKAYFLAANCSTKQGQYSEAEEYFDKALKIAPLEPDIWNNLGLLHYWQGRNSEAFDELRVAAAYAPEDTEILFNLALCSTALEKYEKAIECYDACITQKKDFYDAFNNKGMLLRMLGQIWDALECYDSAINIDPYNPAALCNSAFLLKDLGYDDRAIQRYYSALQLRPYVTSIHNNLALLFCRIGNLEKARNHFYHAFRSIDEQIGSNQNEERIEVIDVGYKVAYLISLWVTTSSITILAVKPLHQFTNRMP
jgi:tetratricopeptide (TPR) repeat protein